MSDLRERVATAICVGIGLPHYSPCDDICYPCRSASKAAIALIRAEVLEEAARVADHLNGWGADCGNEGHAQHIAAAIRALKEEK